MWSKRVLEAYLNALEQTRKDTEVYIGELLGMIESQKLLHGKSYTHAFEAGFAYSLSMTTQLEPYLMVMSRIKPSLSLEIRSARRHIDPNLRWRVQVVCIEHKHLWELATCLHSKKRGRTSFSTELTLPLEVNEDVGGYYTATLPLLQLNHEAGIRDQAAQECQGRFQFQVCLINDHNEEVSPIVRSSPFELTSYSSRRNDQSMIKQAQRARMMTSHIRRLEIDERVNTTRVFLLHERKHVLPKMTMISPCSITTSDRSEFVKIEISGHNFHRPNVVRIDSEYDDADILKQSIVSTTSSVFASVKIPRSPGAWMLKVRNFDDPNLDSDEYYRLNFVSPEELEPEPECDSEMFEGLPPLFSLDSDYLSLPPYLDSATEERVEVILERYKLQGKSSFLESDNFSFSEKSMFHYHIMNGYTHTVAAMLNSVEPANKHNLKMRFGAVPAMLSLLSENPCTVILCIALYCFEQREMCYVDFKKLLAFILKVDRTTPLHPSMMLDFLEIEIQFDARIRCVKLATVLSEAFLAEDDAYNSGDELSSPSQSDEEDECVSTSDEDYEEPPAKILKSTTSAPGAPLKISIKIEQAKDNLGFLEPPSPLRSSLSSSSSLSPSSLSSSHCMSKDEPSSPHECEWDHCLVCERDIPIMLQTQNPTWAAIMRVVFFSFIQVFPDTEYWKVRQAYKYIEDHWDKLCPGKSQGVGAWRKQLQDALSHNKQYFVSGMHIYGQKGYWGLKQIIDPWAITDEVDFPKRAYNHQPRRGRPPKGSHKKRFLSKLKKSKKHDE